MRANEQMRHLIYLIAIPRTDGFVYLGLPVGDTKYVENFYLSL